MAGLVWGTCPPGAAPAQEGSASLSPVVGSQSLPADPALVSGRLDNGLRYLILDHGTPPDRAHALLRVDAGSLDELDDERGMARFAQTLAHAWSRGDALERLRARGLSEVEDLTSRTDYDRTSFSIAMPGSDRATLGDGLAVLASMARGGLIDAPTTDAARRAIEASLRAEGDGVARARAQWLEELGGASLFGRRPPEGDGASIGRVTPEGLAVFRKRWYRASNMTLIVVGAVDARECAALIADAFSTLEGGGEQTRQDRGIGTADRRRAVVGADTELNRAQIAVLRVAPAREPVRTVEGLRRFVLEQAAMLAMEIRLRSAMSEDRLSGDRLRVYSADLFRSMQFTQIAVGADGGSWRDVLDQLCTEIARVREHGFTPGEVEEARRRLETRLEAVALDRPGLPSAELIRWLSYSDAQGHTWVDPAQELAFTRRILLEADAPTLSRVFRSLAPEGEEVLLVSAPVGDRASVRDEAMRTALAAFSTPTHPVPDQRPRARLLERTPEGGQIIEISAHPPSGVWSALMDNGVRVHHTRVRGGGDRVVIHLTLSTPGTGDDVLSLAAASAWDEPALEGLGSVGVRRFMGESGLEAGAWAEGGGVHLKLETDAEHLTSAMELAHKMLSVPVIEPPRFERWKRQEIARVLGRARDPLARAEDELLRSSPATERGARRPLSPGRVASVTIEQARARMRSLIDGARIEAAIVGDVSRTEAFELCERYLGSLSARPHVSADAGAAPAQTPGAVADIVRDVRVETVTPVAGVLVGLVACDSGRVRDAHLLSLAAQILEQRLTRRLRDELGLVPEAPVELNPGTAGSGWGTLLVRAAPVPERAEEVADLIEQEIRRMSEDGVSEQDLLSIVRRVERAYLEAVITPAFWGGKLADLEQADRSLDDIVGVLDRQSAFTPEDVREALARYATANPRVRIIARPDTDD